MNKDLDPYRLVALIAGVGFFIVGIVMVFLGISAEGSIDIQGAIVSGKIKTGSAGLFVLFFSFLIIVVSIAIPWPQAKEPKEPLAGRSSRFRRALSLFLLLLGLSVGAVLAGFLAGEESLLGFLMASVFFGFMAFTAMIFLIDTIEKGD